MASRCWNWSVLTGSSHAFAACCCRKLQSFITSHENVIILRNVFLCFLIRIFPLGCLRTGFYFPVVKPSAGNLSRTFSSSGIIKKHFFSWRKLELLCNRLAENICRLPRCWSCLCESRVVLLFRRCVCVWLKLRSCLVLCCVCPARFCHLWLIGSLLNSHYKPESQKNFRPELFSGSPDVLRPAGKERGKSCLDCSFSWSEYFGFPCLRYMETEAADKVCMLFSCLGVWTRI